MTENNNKQRNDRWPNDFWGDLYFVLWCAVMALGVLGALVQLASCGDNRAPRADLDAPPPADAEPDADIGCCIHYPDQGAIGTCAAPSFPPCTCGVVACQRPPEDGGGFLKIGICGPPPDGGTCDLPDGGL